MRTAVSIPEEIFRRAERLRRRTKRSRSRLFSDALEEYLVRHSPDEFTEAINNVCDDLGEDAAPDPFVSAAAERILLNTEW
jgi:Ribbon-helix-helix protein, copG family